MLEPTNYETDLESRSILVWPILKPAPMVFCSVESKTKLHFFI